MSIGFVTITILIICSQSLNVLVNAQLSSTISGTVRCGSGCSTLGLSNGDPINVAGKVIAVMTMALDSNTGAPRPDLPDTNAQTTFDASANGYYVLQGLLPGVYDLYASANGYQMALVQSAITIHPGQTFHYDAYLTPCPPSGCT